MTGLRGLTCPWQAMRDPFVGAVIEAHRWLGRHVPLETQYPAGVPKALFDGLGVYESALNAVIVHDLRERQKHLDEEREKNARAGGDFRKGPPRRRGPR